MYITMSFEEDGIIKAFEESLIENCLDPTMRMQKGNG